MNYQAALRYLFSLGRELAAPTQAAAAKFDLENITILSEHLGRPDRRYPIIHIAGTNGKGSTAAFMESILRSAGFRTGLYTSPHLEKINERFRVNGQEISDDAFAESFSRIHGFIEELLASGKLPAHPTFFEFVTALAFEHFAQSRVDFAVVEVGLGGRLDATNIVTPEVSIITHIDFDHENFLGHSLSEIAGEKAGILKPGVPVVLAEQRPEALAVILARAQQLGSSVVQTGAVFHAETISEENGYIRAEAIEVTTGWRVRLAPQLAGRFQLGNALNAVAAARIQKSRGTPIPDEAIEQGIANAVWPGRLEKLQSSPDVYLDGAHNPSAARELAFFLEQNFAGRKIFLIFGAMRDKAVDEIAGVLFPRAAEVIFTQPRNSRALSAAQLEKMAGDYAASSRVIPDADKALETALAAASSSDLIFITGSLYLVGELRHHWKQPAGR